MKLATSVILAMTIVSGIVEARPIDRHLSGLNKTAPLSAFDSLHDTAAATAPSHLEGVTSYMLSTESVVQQDLVGE